MNEIPSQLQSYFQDVFPERTAPVITNFATMNSGWESDVHRFTVEWGPAQARVGEDLVLRIYPGADANEKSAHEYDSLKLLWQRGYPVPRVDLLERSASPFGKPFLIMQQIHGRGMWQPMFHASPEEQQKLLNLFCRLFTQLHALEWRSAFADAADREPPGPHAVITRQLERWQSVISPLLLSGFQSNWEWLLKHQNEVISQKACIVHWDFHPDNILLKPDGSAVVIDWTGFDITDYRFDLAWTLLLISTHENMRWREPILSEYERQAGHSVADLDFFDVAVCLRRLISVIVSVKVGADKLGMRPGAEQMMRSQAPALRQVYELLLARTHLTIPDVEQFLNEA